MNVRRALLLLAVGGLAIAACSDDGKSSPTTTGAPTTDAPGTDATTTVAESTTSTISPDASQILFISDNGTPGVYQLWLVNADGSDAHAITSGPISHYHPSWSPDGTKIVFQGTTDHGIFLFTVNADGTGETQLTNGGHDQSPSWSPDGSKIVYDAKASGPVPFFIWVMNADGSGAARLTPRDNDEYDAAFSPDGTKVAFAVQDFEGTDIWIINTDGSGLLALTDAHGENDHPAWSPDGTKIVFDSTRDGASQIYVMNADGTEQQALAPDAAVARFFPSWSADGKRIAFDAGDTNNYATFEIWTMNADGSEAKAITTNTADDGVPVWKP